MKKTANLRFDEEVIKAAKRYAKAHNTSLSKLVENFFRKIAKPPKEKYLSEELEGCLKN